MVEAIERARAYAGAGADGIFAPGLINLSLIARLAEESRLPLHIMMGDGTPPVAVLAQRGGRQGELRSGPYLLAMKALEEAARAALG